VITPETLIADARTLIGLPYRHLGRGPFAYDCLGLVLEVVKRAGLVPAGFDYQDYSENAEHYILEQQLDASGFLTRLDNWRVARPGDLVLQKFRVNLPASHLILVTNFDGTEWWGVHASRRGVVEQRIAHHERNHGAFRLKEVARG
jgi:cell wall-associated NlpC family hydrolase